MPVTTHLGLYERRSHREILTAEEELALARRVRAGDADARNEMIERNIPMVLALVRRSREGQIDDLIQGGMVGLIRAVDLFDPDRGWKFSTYASAWIKQGIARTRLVLEQTIHVPEYTAGRLDLKPELRAAARTCANVTSLARYWPDGRDLDVPAPESERPSNGYERARLEAALAHLHPRYALAVRLYYGFDGHKWRSFRDVGFELGYSDRRAQRVVARAIEQLRRILGPKETVA